MPSGHSEHGTDPHSKAGSLPHHPPCRPGLSSASALHNLMKNACTQTSAHTEKAQAMCAPGALLLKVQGTFGCRCEW